MKRDFLAAALVIGLVAGSAGAQQASGTEVTIINRPDGTVTTVTTENGTTSWDNSGNHGGGQSGRDHGEIVHDIVNSIESGGGTCDGGATGLDHLISCAPN